MDTQTDLKRDSRTESNIRLLLRILRNPLVSILALYYALYYVNAAGLYYTAVANADTGLVQSLVSGASTVANLLLVYLTFAYFVERRPVTELALPRMGRELGFGLLLGFGLITACVLIAMALGIYRIDGFDSWQNMLPTGIALSLPVYEELAFRGVVFRILEGMFGSWVALVLSSLVFGGVHMVNGGESLAGVASIAFVLGPMLVAPFLITRRLWLGIGLHAAWNYTMGKIYAINVSGTPSPGLFKATFAGPELLTGGNAGMEGSLICILVALTFTVVMLVLAARRGNIVPPSWTRKH
ncbi:MAG: CPBP family intramembrane metalloprotease [Oscillatoriophycideae cyanobacterium NC_groundwater_1537_Pr4_S-0.65um_50_18]|nr:CPBP family intramembrane metalloprotease [Oscillatoriophycideae cyanobacterium NC_groundwater_1537_Pr4_S-0.65um_50_18]